MGKSEDKSSKLDFLVWPVIIGLVGLFAWAIVIPNLRPARVGSHIACINNLRQIDAAAREFALEKGKTNGEAINFPDDLTPYIKLNSQGKIPSCPQGDTYSIKRVGDIPTCSLGTNGIPGHSLP